MKRAVLFRFHTEPLVCRDNLRSLRLHNPGVPVFGLFGGDERDVPRVRRIVGPFLQDLYVLRGKTADWKHRHGDLAIKDWYENVGTTMPFDMLHHVEWDLRLFAPLAQLYGHIPSEGVGLTSLVPLQEIASRWWWLARDEGRREWQELLRWAQERFGFQEAPSACEFAGVCLPRSFLEQLRGMEVPLLCHDELRLPLLSRIFRLPLYDTKLCRAWFDEREKMFFNCETREISIATIRSELARPDGRRAFHPFRRIMISGWSGRGRHLEWVCSRKLLGLRRKLRSWGA